MAASSARVYAQTLRAWQSWCAAQGLHPLDLTPRQVLAFLASAETTKATRQRQLSALRKLAQMRFILTPGDDEARRLHEALKVIKVPAMSDQGKSQERAKKALTSAEAAALVWADVDFEHGVLTIRHSKRDKARSAPLAGEFALEALQTWHAAQPVDARRAKKELKLRYG